MRHSSDVILDFKYVCVSLCFSVSLWALGSLKNSNEEIYQQQLMLSNAIQFFDFSIFYLFYCFQCGRSCDKTVARACARACTALQNAARAVGAKELVGEHFSKNDVSQPSARPNME